MRTVLYSGRYEEREYAVLHRMLTRSDRVLELGSGLGFITVVCARKCGSASVTSVEANPLMLPTLQQTFRLNGVTPNLVAGVVSRDGASQDFFVNDQFWSSSTYDRGGRKLSVSGLAFEDLVSRYLPTVIVMDIEGGEVALSGAKVGPSVRAVVLELHASVTGAEGADAVRSWMLGQGFQATRDWGNRSVVVYERSS